jgi:hypothetical protein
MKYLQLGPTSYFSPPLNNAIMLWIHQGINPLIRSEPSWSNHLWKLHHSHTQSMLY